MKKANFSHQKFGCAKKNSRRYALAVVHYRQNAEVQFGYMVPISLLNMLLCRIGFLFCRLCRLGGGF